VEGPPTGPHLCPLEEPKRYCPWQTCYDRFVRWRRDGTWERLLSHAETKSEAVGEVVREVSVDSTIARACQHAAGARRARGGVGTLAVQIAKAYGAEVTGVDNTKKLEMVRSLGADHVIDYTQEDFTQSGRRYDLIFDIPGNHPFSDCRRVLTPDGKYVLIGHDRFGQGAGRWFGSLPRVLKLVALSPFVSQMPTPNFSMPDKKNQMVVLKELLEDGKITPVIDRTYPLSEVPEAIRYLEEGHAQGKVVITV
jgi:NADPH-dependent curcumin reductase CurA